MGVRRRVVLEDVAVAPAAGAVPPPSSGVTTVPLGSTYMPPMPSPPPSAVRSGGIGPELHWVLFGMRESQAYRPTDTDPVCPVLEVTGTVRRA